MGFDLMLIATNANGMSIPFGAKCCFCHQLLDDGISLSGCSHNACYKCMKKRASIHSICPLDGQHFEPKGYRHLSEEIEVWLRNIKLKCQWFDGKTCTATGIAIRNAHRHEEVCPNNPTNKLSAEQRDVVKLVENWMQNNEINGEKGGQTLQRRNSKEIECKCHNQCDSCDAHEQWFNEKTPKKGFKAGKNRLKSGYGYKPVKRTIGNHFFTSSMNPEVDFDWRKRFN